MYRLINIKECNTHNNCACITWKILRPNSSVITAYLNEQARAEYVLNYLNLVEKVGGPKNL